MQKDLHRASDHALFKRETKDAVTIVPKHLWTTGMQRLYKVLRAYAGYPNSTHGYCQGMHAVAANILTIFQDEPDEDDGVELAFWCLVQLIEDPRFDIASYYMKGFKGWQRDAPLIIKVVKDLEPSPIDPVEATTGMCMKWFSTIFVSETLAPSAYLVVWDAMLAMTHHPDSHKEFVTREMSIRVATALFARAKKEKPEMLSDAEGFKELTSTWARQQTDGQALIEEALAFDASTHFNDFKI